MPVRQTLPPVRKTETEEKTVRRLLLQIPARLRKVLIIINCGEATLLPPRFCFSIRHRKDVLFYSVIASAAWRSRRLAYERLCNLLRRLATGLPRSLRPLAKTSFFIPSSRAQRGDPEERCANVYANYPVVWQRDCRGRFAPSQRRSFYSVIASAAWRSRGAVCECLYNLLRRLERDCRGRFAPSQRRSFLFRYRVDDVSLLFVDEGYGRNTERNAVVFVGIFFGGFTVCPIAAELEVRRTYGKRLRFGLEMVRSEQVS